MTVKAVMLYRLPQGMTPSKGDVDRITRILVEQFCCVPADHRGGKVVGDRAPALEAVAVLLKQAPAPEGSVVASPASLRDVWLLRMAREAPTKAYLLLRSAGSELRVSEGEPSMRLFLERRLGYQARAQLAIQSVVWAVGDRVSDVTIKLLQVSPQSQAPLLLGVEISYLPVADLAVGRAVLGQLAATLAERVNAAAATLGQPRGELVLLKPPYERFNQDELPSSFGPAHTAVAYHELLSEGLGRVGGGMR